MGLMVGNMGLKRQVYTIKNLDGTVAGTISKSGGSSNKNAKKPKKLQYNFKQVSTRILQAKTSGAAGRTVIMARGKVAMLRQKLKSKEYDEEEIAAAIVHAEKMLRIAKKKQKHLKAEENEKNGQAGGTDAVGDSEEEKEGKEKRNREIAEDSFELDPESLKQQMKRLERLMEEMEREEEEANGMDEFTEELLEVTDQESSADFEMRKKKHRADELKEIIAADMKYLKAMFDKWEREKQSSAAGVVNMQQGASDMGGVFVEIANEQMPVPEISPAAPSEGANMDVTV